MSLYRNWNGGRIITGRITGKPGMIFLGTINNKIFTLAQYCPAHLAPTVDELRRWGADV